MVEMSRLRAVGMSKDALSGLLWSARCSLVMHMSMYSGRQGRKLAAQFKSGFSHQHSTMPPTGNTCDAVKASWQATKTVGPAAPPRLDVLPVPAASSLPTSPPSAAPSCATSSRRSRSRAHLGCGSSTGVTVTVAGRDPGAWPASEPRLAGVRPRATL